MLRAILETEDVEAMNALKAHAKELHVAVLDEENTEENPNEYYYLNGVKVRKGKGKIDIQAMAGSFPDLDLDPETYRKKLWTRNKE